MRTWIIAAVLGLLTEHAWGQAAPIYPLGVMAQQPVQTPSSTTPGTLGQRFQDRLDLVADFGADPTGQKDSGPALQAAINTGKPIYIPAGKYTIATQVTDPNSQPIDITCAGYGSTTLYNGNNNGILSVSTGTNTFSIPVRIKGCYFDALNKGTVISLSGAPAGASTTPLGVVIEDNYFGTLGGNTVGSISLRGISQVKILNNFFENGFLTADPVVISNGSNIIINGNHFFAVGGSWNKTINALDISGASSVTINNNQFNGFNKQINIGAITSNVYITSNILDQGSYGVYMSGTGISNIMMSDDYIATAAAASAGASAVYIEGNNITVQNNTLTAYNSGNYVYDLTNATSNQVTIFNNVQNGTGNNPNNVSLR